MIVARKGSTCLGFCTRPGHGWRTGTVVGTCSTLTKVDGIELARVSDKVLLNCGHYGIINKGSAVLKDEGLAVAMVNTDATTIGPDTDGRVTQGYLTSGASWVDCSA